MNLMVCEGVQVVSAINTITEGLPLNVIVILAFHKNFVHSPKASTLKTGKGEPPVFCFDIPHVNAGTL